MSLRITALLLLILSVLCIPASAQVQRGFINLGFELPVLNPNAADCPGALWPYSTVIPAGDVKGWETTHVPMTGWCTNNGGTTGFVPHTGVAPLIDIWKDGKVANVRSRAGAQHAELNALVASRIYQTVCLLENEQINWRFSHRARGDVTGGGGNGNDVARFVIHKAGGAQVQEIARASSNADGAGFVASCGAGVTCNAAQSYSRPPSGVASHWVDYGGNFVWTDARGNYEFGFEAVSTVSATIDQGNLIDDIQLDGLIPFVELSQVTYTSPEGVTDPQLAIKVSGVLTAPITVLVDVTAGTATAGVDYTAPSTISVNIPADPNGYDGKSISFANEISILMDSVQDGGETFSLQVRQDPAFLIQSTSTCGSAGNAQATYTILDTGLKVEKVGVHQDLNGNGLKDAGDRIDYTLTFTNIGQTNLLDVTATDALLGGSLWSPAISLAAGLARTETKSYTILDTDMVAGQVLNTVQASAKEPIANKVVTGGDSHKTTLDIVRKLDFLKVAASPVLVDVNNNGVTDVGDRVNFSFTLTNQGTVPATIATVTDALPSFTFVGLPVPNTLAPTGAGSSYTFSGYHTLTQLDIDAGTVSNQATATYSAQGVSDSVNSHAAGGAANTVIPIPETPASQVLEITKSITNFDLGADGVAGKDDVVTYEIMVTNKGNTTVNGLTVTDVLLGLSLPIGTLAPGGTKTLPPQTYSLVQADIGRGYVTNTASVSGTTARGTMVSATSLPVTQAIVGTAKADLLKEAFFVNLVGSDLPEIGDRIDYVFTVTNTGTLTVETFDIVDNLASVIRTRTPPPLQPGNSDNMTFRAERYITADDLDAGSISNIGTLKGTATGGIPITTTSHGPGGVPTTIALMQKPGLRSEMTARWIDANGNGLADPGEVVEFEIKLFNTGNTGLNGIVISAVDPTVAPTATARAGARGVLLPLGFSIPTLPAFSAPFIQRVSYVLTQADIDAGLVAGQIQVSGEGPQTLPDGERHVSVLSDDPLETTQIDINGDGIPDDATHVTLPQAAKLEIVKTGRFLEEGLAQEGMRIEYQISVSNVGNVSAFSVAPSDPGPTFSKRRGTGVMSAFTPEPTDLAPHSNAVVFTAIYTMSAADVANALAGAGEAVNTATAKGRGAKGNTITSPDATATLALPTVRVAKQAGGEEFRRADTIPYRLTILSYVESAPVTIRLQDIMPNGFHYLANSLKMDGVAIEPHVDGRELSLDAITVFARKPVVVDMLLQASASVKPGQYINTARLLDPQSGQVIGPAAQASVMIREEGQFDCGDIIGTVFNDHDRNGYQDAGETGVAAVRIVMVDGTIVTTDGNGQFHIPCAMMPDQRIGSNFVVKIDPRSLPSGYRILSENPVSIRLTAGKSAQVHFAVAIGRVIRIDINDEAFLTDRPVLEPVWESRLQSIVDLLAADPSILRLVYHVDGQDAGLARRRMGILKDKISALWKSLSFRAPLEIEMQVIDRE